MKSTLKNMVLVLFTITAISALLVALVNDVTKDAIAEAEQKNKDLAKFEVLPSFEGEAEMRDITREIGDFKVNVTEVKAGGKIVGYAVEAPSITANGYADKIYLMVGFVEEDGRAKIHGVKVISQKETPGLGANMINPGNKLESSILGKYADELVFKVKKDDKSGSFDALTGSTISSRAYTNAVETAYAGYLWATGQLFAVDDSNDEEVVEPETSTVTTLTEDDSNMDDEQGVANEESVAETAAEDADVAVAPESTDAVESTETPASMEDVVNDTLSGSETQEGEHK